MSLEFKSNPSNYTLYRLNLLSSNSALTSLKEKKHKSGCFRIEPPWFQFKSTVSVSVILEITASDLKLLKH